MNWLNDMDWGWWPFLFLRPPKHEPLTTKRVGLMSVMYGPILGIAIALVPSVFGRRPLAESLLGSGPITVPISCVFFFVVYRFTFAIAWNVRAEELRSQGKAKG